MVSEMMRHAIKKRVYNYDGGDCCGHNVNTDVCSQCHCHFIENCTAGVHPLVGTDFCYEETNNDNGDCCGPDISCK